MHDLMSTNDCRSTARAPRRRFCRSHRFIRRFSICKGMIFARMRLGLTSGHTSKIRGGSHRAQLSISQNKMISTSRHRTHPASLIERRTQKTKWTCAINYRGKKWTDDLIAGRCVKHGGLLSIWAVFFGTSIRTHVALMCARVWVVPLHGQGCSKQSLSWGSLYGSPSEELKVNQR